MNYFTVNFESGSKLTIFDQGDMDFFNKERQRWTGLIGKTLVRRPPFNLSTLPTTTYVVKSVC